MEQEIDPLSALGALIEPLRRRVYEYVASLNAEVSRDGVASALGVARSVAAFHLDKLVDAGLLDVDYRRPPGRRGPGAGRPAKWYRRVAGEVTVSVPERRYDLAAELLARAVEGGGDVEGVLADVAWRHGRAIASGLFSASNEVPADAARPALVGHVVELLARYGYEPRVSGSVVTMANCPFHALAEEHRDLVCHMNHALLSGVVEEAGLSPACAQLDPEPGRCCVTIVA